MKTQISIGLICAFLGAAASGVAVLEFHDKGKATVIETSTAVKDIGPRFERFESVIADSNRRIGNLETRAEVSIKDREDLHRELSEYKAQQDKRLERMENKIDKIADAVGAKK